MRIRRYWHVRREHFPGTFGLGIHFWWPPHERGVAATIGPWVFFLEHDEIPPLQERRSP